MWLHFFLNSQWGGRRHGEDEPAAETVHVSVRLQQLANRPVGDAQQREVKADVQDEHVADVQMQLFDVEIFVIKIWFMVHF